MGHDYAQNTFREGHLSVQRHVLRVPNPSTTLEEFGKSALNIHVRTKRLKTSARYLARGASRVWRADARKPTTMRSGNHGGEFGKNLFPVPADEASLPPHGVDAATGRVVFVACDV